MSDSVSLSEADLAQVEAGIPASTGAIPDKVRGTFCEEWPKAKPVLEAVQEFIKEIPGVGEIASKFVGFVVKWGDRYHKVMCEPAIPVPKP